MIPISVDVSRDEAFAAVRLALSRLPAGHRFEIDERHSNTLFIDHKDDMNIVFFVRYSHMGQQTVEEVAECIFAALCRFQLGFEK